MAAKEFVCIVYQWTEF